MPRDSSRFHFPFFLLTAGTVLLATAFAFPARSVAADDKPVWSDQENPIVEQLHGLRKLPDDVRAQTTKELALQIRQLPVTPNKLRLAGGLAGLSTEGDFGHDTLQEVANTLAAALREQPQPGKNGEPGSLYVELAELVRYEHVQAAMDAPQFAAATAELEANDAQRQQANFTLVDLHGKNWTLRDLQGKVVLLNFWATWCPPCRKEMPDLEALYLKFKDKDQGFVVLAISDEDASKVSPFLAERNITYPVLLDPGRKVNEQFRIEGIPKSFVYDRSGKLVAQSIDMRTERQFLEMLAQAGLQ
jgi:peroxiredoxin